MADPLSILAVLGLAYMGKKMSDKQPEFYEEPETTQIQEDRPQQIDFIQDDYEPAFRDDRRKKFEQPSFTELAPNARVSGDQATRDRAPPYISGKMNNLAPVPRELVGPGLGVPANVPSYGGFQQMYRVNPINVNEHKLTTLPGRAGPSESLIKSTGIIGELTHYKPETTAYLPARRPELPGRAQGQGGAMSGVTVRPRHEHTKRPTVRSETGYRDDGLGFTPAKRVVSGLQMAQDPTRNKWDGTDEQFKFNDRAAPGVTSFTGGYHVTPEALEGIDAIRPSDRRGNANRPGNAGRMNVRESALKTVGKVTAVRSDVSRVDGWTGQGDGQRFQNYGPLGYQNNNAYKGAYNPNSYNLNIAKTQLQNNPLAHTLAR